MTRLLVWDLPTRLFHWLFAIAFLAAYLLGDAEGWLGWHSYFGYLAGGLVLFRLAWGFLGGHFSRFSTFPPNPASALNYLKDLAAGGGTRHVGHNPAGALAIHALLFLGLATALSGMALLGADPRHDPLAGLVQGSWKDLLEEAHEFCANAMLALVALHLMGVALGSLRHGENLPRAMVTGYKDGQADDARPVKPALLVAALMLAGLGTFTVLHDFTIPCDDNVAAWGQAGERQELGGGDDDD